MRSAVFFPVVIAALAVTASSSGAQSLGDVAKREEQRRAAVRAASKTYSNAELRADFSALPAPAPAPAADQPATAPSSTTAPSTPSSNAGAGATVAAPAPAAKPAEDEAAWRWRAGEIRDRLARAQKRVDSFTGTPKDDPLEQARTDELIKQAQEQLQRAVDAQRLFEMQADVAGVPVDWIK